MKILRTASLGSNFTGSYKKRVYYTRHRAITSTYYHVYSWIQYDEVL